MQLVQAARAARRVLYHIAPDATDPKSGKPILEQLDDALRPFKNGIDPSQAASVMGSVRSKNKSKTSAQNGKLGGRPKKVKI